MYRQLPAPPDWVGAQPGEAQWIRWRSHRRSWCAHSARRRSVWLCTPGRKAWPV